MHGETCRENAGIQLSGDAEVGAIESILSHADGAGGGSRTLTGLLSPADFKFLANEESTI